MIKCRFSQVWVSTKGVYSTLYSKLFRFGAISGKAKLGTPIISKSCSCDSEVYSSPDLSVPSRTGKVVGLADGGWLCEARSLRMLRCHSRLLFGGDSEMVVWQQCLNKPNLPEALAETSKPSRLGTVPCTFCSGETKMDAQNSRDFSSGLVNRSGHVHREQDLATTCHGQCPGRTLARGSSPGDGKEEPAGRNVTERNRKGQKMEGKIKKMQGPSIPPSFSFRILNPPLYCKGCFEAQFGGLKLWNREGILLNFGAGCGWYFKHVRSASEINMTIQNYGTFVGSAIDSLLPGFWIRMQGPKEDPPPRKNPA